MLLFAIGMALVLAQGGIDLSLGGVATLSGMIFAIFVSKVDCSMLSMILGASLAVSMGAASGFLLGYSIMVRSAPPLIYSWALGLIYTSICIISCQSNWLHVPGATISGIPIRSPLSLSHQTALYLVVAICSVIALLDFFALPKRLAAIGANRDSATYIGINSKSMVLLSYCLSGSFASIAGVYSVFLLRTASNSDLIGRELSAVAICVIGGSSLSGGYVNLYSVLIAGIFYSFVSGLLNIVQPGNSHEAYTQIANSILAAIFLCICLVAGPKLSGLMQTIQVQRQTKD